MTVKERRARREDSSLAVRTLANQAFSRAAGASLIEGNDVRLLKDAAENYPAWLAAIGNARRYIHFESYIIHEDDAGWMFAEALAKKAREGVRVRLLYDWMGGFRTTSRSFWSYLRTEGVEVRCYNPPQLDSPLGWLSRDHRKTLTVDGKIGFVTGLCVGRMWVGDPEKKIEPWRDTGVEVHGPAVADIEQAFSQVWTMLGERIPADEIARRDQISPAGEMAVRIVASEPATAGMMRLDQLVAALARKQLWLTDAYYAGTSSYVEALRAAARDRVDVRLLVPNGTDIPILRPLSRAGYRPLLEAGVRVFEWNGPMLHAKTAVADSNWARVGSTNLNVASWFGNLELDVVIENEVFAQRMDEMYLGDLENATEVVLDARHKLRAPNEPRHPRAAMAGGGGSAGRAAAGALRISNAVGAAFTNRRVLEPVEARLMLTAGVLLFLLAVLFTAFPRVFAYPLSLFFIWVAIALLYRGYKLHRNQDWRGTGAPKQLTASDESARAATASKSER
jgi:cardiolipin synthase